MKCAWIHQNRDPWRVTTMCQALGVSRARYYQWLSRPLSERDRRDRSLLAKIHVAFRLAKRRYGSPRVHSDLVAQGERVGEKRVARLMRSEGLKAKRPRKFRVTTQSLHAHPVAPNVLDRRFEVKEVNRVWASDMTFLPTREGWLYLAVVLDLCSRRVIGWSMGKSLEQSLTLSALEMALSSRRPPGGVVHHSDRGSQYASHAYRELLDRHGFTPSMSRSGDCWDNAMVESFFATLKTESDGNWPTRDAARSEVVEFIESWYNRRRRHSALGYLTPEEFEARMQNAA